jgi:hypothetical protein
MAAPHVYDNYWGKGAERLLRELATRQHGVVAIWQLLGLGFSRRWIDHRLAIDRLHPVHRGVYAVGTLPLSPLGRCMAAALAGGDGSAVGFGAAAWLWDLAETLPQTIDVYAPARRRPQRGLSFHENLPPDEATTHESIPVTIPSRTLLDLAPRTEPHRLERMLERSEGAGLGSTLTLAALLDRYPRRPGTPRIRQILQLRSDYGPRPTRSDPESLLLALCDAHGIPRPLTNCLLEVAGRTYELDAYWPDQRLAVEYDSWEFHGDRVSFRDDRIRDRVLATAGVRTVRATAFDLGPGSAAFAADLIRLRAL